MKDIYTINIITNKVNIALDKILLIYFSCLLNCSLYTPHLNLLSFTTYTSLSYLLEYL